MTALMVVVAPQLAAAQAPSGALVGSTVELNANSLERVTDQANRACDGRGYAEVNHRTPSQWLALLGVQYYGSNNPYNVPAFATVNGSVSYAFSKRISLQLSGNNLTSAYSSKFSTWFGETPVEFVNRLNLHISN